MRCPRALSKPSFWGYLARWEGQLICFPFSMIGHNVWPPNIHSRPLELYPLYKCRVGHLVFSKLAVSQVWHDTIGTTWHWQNTLSAEHVVGRTRLSAEHVVGRTRLSAEHVVGRTRLSAEHVVGRTRLSAEHVVGRTRLSAEHVVGRTRLSAEHIVGRTRLSAEHVVGRTTLLAEQGCRQNTTVGRIVFWAMSDLN